MIVKIIIIPFRQALFLVYIIYQKGQCIQEWTKNKICGRQPLNI